MNETSANRRALGTGPDSWSEFFKGHGLAVIDARPSFFRRGGGHRTIIGFEVTFDDGDGIETLPVYVKSYESRERFEEVATKWARLNPRDTPLGEGVRFLEDERTIVFIHPNDGAMRFLANVTDLDKLKRLTDWSSLGGGPWRMRRRRSSLVALSYKPEHRFVARIDLALVDDRTGEKRRHVAILRAFPDKRGARLSEVCTSLASAGLADLIPRQRGTLLDGCVHLEDSVEGRELEALLRTGEPATERVIAAIKRLHGTYVNGLSTSSAEDVLGAALESLGAMCAHPTSARAAALLASRSPEGLRPQAALHGDLHPRQILVSDRAVTLVDFERIAEGDPLLDVGRFVAELRVLEMESDDRTAGAARALADALSREYAGNDDAVPGVLAFYVAAGLVEIAAIRHRRCGWNPEGAEVGAILAEVVDVLAPLRQRSSSPLERTPTWQTLYPRGGTVWPGVALVNGETVAGEFNHRTGEFEPFTPDSDPDLPELASWLSRGELVAYRPGRRATVRTVTAAGTAYVKVVRRGRGDRLRGVLDSVTEATADVSTGARPRLARRLDVGGRDVVATAEMSGESLRAAIERGEPVDHESLSDALIAFQSAAVPDLSEPRPSDVPWGWIARTCATFPDMASELTGLALELHALIDDDRDPRECLVHDDLHPGNLVNHGGRWGFLDLDQCGRGEHAIDVGNLAAELTVSHHRLGHDHRRSRAEGDRFIACYRDRGGLAAPARIAASRSTSTLRLACVYSFRRAHPELPGRLLRLAHELSKEAR